MICTAYRIVLVGEIKRMKWGGGGHVARTVGTEIKMGFRK